MLTGVAVRFFLVVRLVALASDSSDTFDSYSILKGIDEKEDGGILAGIIADFMSDSQVQLVVDLDLFKSLFVDTAHRLEYGVRSGDESYAQQLIELLKPLKEYDVSMPCLADITHMLWSAVEYARWVRHPECTNCTCTERTEIRNQHQWIFNVIDAFGKPPSGILSGNNLWIGSWSACRRISVLKNRQGQRWSGQYCMAMFQPFNRDNPLKAMDTQTKYDPTAHCRATSILPNKTEANDDDDKCFTLIPLLNYGFCTPDTCTNYDVKKIVEFVYKGAEVAADRNFVCNVDINCRNDRPENHLSYSRASMTVLFFIIFVVVLMIFGTLYDYIVYQKELFELDEATCYKKQNWFVKTIIAFSVYTNGKVILRTEKGENQIHCLHGIRVLSMFWIILGHTYYYICTNLTTDNLLPTMVAFPKRFFNLIIVQAPLAVDTFFYLSGMLTCFLFMKKFSKEASKGRSIFSPNMWSLFYIHRFFRLTPIYLIVMILDVTLFTYISDGPFWRPIESNYCRKSWWTNLLYMNNLLLQDVETCMGWTWYLANDMQFHFFSPILLILLYKANVMGIIVGILGIICSTLIHLAIILHHNYPPAPLLTAKLQIVKDLETYWPDVYIKPYIRCPPYITGILVGYLLYKVSLTPKLPKRAMALGWIISTTLGLGSVFGLYNYARTGDISEIGRILYALFGRNGFVLAVAWVSFACATGYGGPINSLLGWRAWIPLSRITFCAYLIHPILLQIYNLSRPHPFHFTTFYQMMHLFAVAVVLAYFVGFFFSLAFEMPVSILESLSINKLISSLRPSRHKNTSLESSNKKNEASQPCLTDDEKAKDAEGKMSLLQK